MVIAAGERKFNVIRSYVDTKDPAFQENRAHQIGLLEQLRERLEVVKKGGPAASVARHRARGKMTARERIEKLVDHDRPFLEFSPLAAWEMYDGQAHSAGIVTGIGMVSGRECMIMANDATVKAGAYYPLTVKKAPPSPGDSPAKPAPLYLPGRFRRRISSPAGRCVPRQGTLWPCLLQRNR